VGRTISGTVDDVANGHEGDPEGQKEWINFGYRKLIGSVITL
jgi:hypothetical protein